MGLKIINTYYSDKDIRTVLIRKGYAFPYLESPLCVPNYKIDLVDQGEPVKFEDMYKIFKKIVMKRLNQTKQEFLDSL